MAETTLPSLGLSSESCQRALCKYLDESKPDPLAKKQVESWNLEWRDENLILEVVGEHMLLLLYPSVRWSWDQETRCGSLDFCLKANARFLAKSKIQKNSDTRRGKEQRAAQKVRAGMLKRLRNDDYVQKLLVEDPIAVCEATIQLMGDEKLEERVSTDDDLLEAIRRCIYSQAESLITVAEFLVAMPFLDLPENCPLGHRARLRLLEDAMLNECEREGENDLLDELHIGTKQNNNGGNADDEDDSDESQTIDPKRTKR